MKAIKKILVLPVIASTAFMMSITNSAFTVNAASIANFETYTSSQNITLNNQNVSITSAWIYTITWTLSDWMILVDVWEGKEVTLNLSSVNITNKTGSAIYVKSWKATINLVENTKNILTDGKEYTNLVSDENATISAVEDLTITWTWSLTINWNYNDWINTKDDLIIKNWNITITSADDALRWNDSITVEAGTLNINSTWDALKSDNESKGYITINWWNLNISSGSDGMEAYNSLTINSWTVNISKSVEWLESWVITINGWNISIKSSDDALNASDSSVTTENAPWVSNSNLKIIINGWTLTVDSDTDWLDSNWNIEINWWKVIIYGPVSWANSAVDFDWTFTINAWDFIAFWTSEMAKTANTTSKQNSVLINLTSNQTAGTKFTVKNNSWVVVYEATAKKSFNSVLLSTSSLKNGTYTYEVNWTNSWNFTVSSVSTQVWNSWMMWGKMWGRPQFNWQISNQPVNNWQMPTPPNFSTNLNPELQAKIDLALEKIFTTYSSRDVQSRNKIFDTFISTLKSLNTDSFNEDKKYVVNSLIIWFEQLKNRN